VTTRRGQQYLTSRRSLGRALAPSDPPPDQPEHRGGQQQVARDEQDGVLYGTVKWFKAKKGYGFITPDAGGEDVYVHYSRIEMPGFKTLEEGRRVSYEAVRGKRGPEAARVRPL